MKKKLWLFLMVGMLILAVGSCSKDEQPDVPEPTSNEAILRAKEFFESEAGPPALPNIYHEAPTRASENLFLLRDALQADWTQVRSRENEQIVVTEVPMRLTRPIRYTVLIEEQGDTVSLTTQAPYVRMLIGELKDRDSMFCLLVTLLPDESYVGDLSRLAPDPSGSDYAGITLYSYPDGTPAWGWRYVDGEVSHTLAFDAVDQEWAVTDVRILMGYHSDVMTRGIHDINYIDEIVVIGSRKDRPWDEELILLIGGGGGGNPPGSGPDPGGGGGGNGGGSGGGGGNGGEDGGPTINPFVPLEMTCSSESVANMFMTETNWNAFLSAGLQADFLNHYQNASVEWGSSLDYNSATGSYAMSTPQTDNNPNGVSLTIRQGETVATIHNHPSNQGPSISDAVNLANSYGRNGVHTTSYVACSDGTVYALHAENQSAAGDFASRYIGNQGIRDNFHADYTVLVNSFMEGGMTYHDAFAYALAYLLNVENAGIRVMKMEEGNFIQKQARSQGERLYFETCKP